MAPRRGASTLVRRRAVPWHPLGVGLLGSLSAAPVLVAAGAAAPATLVGPLVYLAGAGIVARRWPHRALGAANQITLLRLVGVSWVAATLPQAWRGSWTPSTSLLVVGVGTLSLLLDGLDGHVARRWGGATAFGARFDAETDAALVLMLSLAVPLLGIAGWWVLLTGVMRYGFLAASLRWRWLGGDLFASQARKVVGVSQGIALLAALLSPLVPAVPRAAPGVVVAVAFAALCWSFGRDARWLHGRRPAR